MTDPHRPIYHFLPPHNWINDPNGLIQFRGEYHLFYQHNPAAPGWGTMVWGHAVGPDLVHWTDRPYALLADQPYDKGGVWTGCMVNDSGTATAVYTGVAPEVQCIATSMDGLSWEKFRGNPVIAHPPEGLKVTGFRDPCVGRDEQGWWMVVGSGIEGEGGVLFLYRSQDLKKWSYEGLALKGNSALGNMWECPNLFPLDGCWALVMSPGALGRAVSMVGRFDGRVFHPEAQGEVDEGGSLYAPQVFRDEHSRAILFGWLREERPDEAVRAAGWAGALSLPRQIRLHGGRLAYEPVPEISRLRGRKLYEGNLELRTGSQSALLRARSRACEVDLTLRSAGAGAVHLSILQSAAGGEKTVVRYEPESGVLSLDRRFSCQAGDVSRNVNQTKLPVRPDDPLRLRVYVDGSIVEAYAAGACLTGRVYPSLPDSDGIALEAISGRATIEACTVWEMTSAFPER